MISRKEKKKVLKIYDQADQGCQIVLEALEGILDLVEKETAMAIIQNPRGGNPELIERLSEIQRKAHQISAFGYRIGEVVRQTRNKLEA